MIDSVPLAGAVPDVQGAFSGFYQIAANAESFTAPGGKMLKPKKSAGVRKPVQTKIPVKFACASCGMDLRKLSPWHRVKNDKKQEIPFVSLGSLLYLSGMGKVPTLTPRVPMCLPCFERLVLVPDLVKSREGRRLFHALRSGWASGLVKATERVKAFEAQHQEAHRPSLPMGTKGEK